LFVFRKSEQDFSYAELVHPTDFHSAVVNEGCGPFEESGPLRAQLFPERLEKGVIRRARICGWFMPAENDLETAVTLAKRFVDEPLPLTT
jgi:hypothetical protein